jgi:hypothetical protein
VVGKKKPPPPPPPKKKITGFRGEGVTAVGPGHAQREDADEPAPPPIPLATRPRF